MSTTQGVMLASLPAGENLNDQLYEALTLNASGQVVRADAVKEVVVGVLAANPGRTTAAGDMVSVMLIGQGGIGLVKANAAITRGHILIPTTTAGRVAGVANTDAIADGVMGFGIALEAATAANDIIRFLAMPIAAGHGV